MNDRILALDMGTSSVRGLVLDASARPLPGALARRKAHVTVDAEGAATINPDEYLASLVECLDELHSGGHLDGVGLVAASAQWHSVLPLGRDGRPLGPVLTWLDSRPEAPTGAALRPGTTTPAGKIRVIRESPTRRAGDTREPAPDHADLGHADLGHADLGHAGLAQAGLGPADPAAFHARTGTWWHGLYWSVRLPWLRERLGASTARFVGLPEYLLGTLLAEAPMSVSQASGTGLLDLRSLEWDGEACALAGARPAELPALAPAGWRGTLRGEYAGRWPALRRAAWAAPVGDGAASNIGSGGVDATRAAVTVGTSAAVRLVQPAPPGAPLPPLPAGLWRYRVDHDRIVTGAAYSNGGNLYAWASRELRLPEGPALDEAMGGRARDTGLWADPRLGGDRPPGRTPAGSGQLRGIGFATTAVDILCALLGAVCRQVAEDVAEIESTLDRRVDVMLGGGAVAASAWWRDEFEAVLAPRRVVDVAQPEVGATGAALIATGQLATGQLAPGQLDTGQSATGGRATGRPGTGARPDDRTGRAHRGD